MSLELANKVAFITGAGAGIGRGISELCFERGCTVFLTDVNGASVEELAATLNARTPAVAGQRAMAATLDVSSEEQWAAAVASCKSAFGRIDVLINNAGIQFVTDLEHTTPEVWNKTMNVNAMGPFLGMRAVVPLMKAQGGGSIVCTASTSAVRGLARLATYCASKAAVRLMCLSLALELIPFNIRVNMVSPGPSDTSMVSRLAVEVNQKRENIGAFAPIARLAKPREIAEAVVFLASDRASYLVGADIGVDGGNTCGLTGRSNL